MKKFMYRFFLLLLILLNACDRKTPDNYDELPITSFTVNQEWVFNYFPQENLDSSRAQINYNDTQWPEVALPHTWSTYETTGDIHPFIKYPTHRDDPYWWNGWGWYRTRFIADSTVAGKKVFIEFDAVQKYCMVWLNGQYIGDHKGGYTSFYFDLTPYLDFAAENVLAVAVSNKRMDEFGIPPATAGNWDVYGGIYRDVRIVVKDKCYIPFQGSYKHQGGTFITTPNVSRDSARVNVQTWVKNDYATSKKVELRTTICDSAGEQIQQLVQTKTILPGENKRFDQLFDVFRQPVLWSPENPYVYRVFSDVYVDGQWRDHLESPLGLRYYRWDYLANRLILNGQPVHIHGTNRHQEYPWLGDAMPKWLHVQDMMDIRYGLNHNFLRGAHYTHDKLVYDFCDRHGIIVCEEIPNIKAIDFSEEVQEQMAREMVRRDRNHPSIFFWSVGNETTDGADSRWIYEEDSTRIIHARKVLPESYGDYVTHTHENMEMENLLRITPRGWYNRDVKNLEPENPQSAGHEEWQHTTARIEGHSKRGRIDMYNGVMWLYADHGADREYDNAPLKHINPKGWVDLYRVPKYLYYLWQANYSDEAMVFIHPHFWQRKYLDQKKDIIIDSNCDQVELLVNGKSAGVLYPSWQNFHTVTFKDIAISDGILDAVGLSNGHRVTQRLIMAGPAERIILQSSHHEITSGKASVVVIRADVTDAAGNRVLGCDSTLTWDITGPASLVGPKVYLSDKDKDEEMEGVFYISTPVANLIRSNGEAGTITVSVSSPGLDTGIIKIIARDPEPEQQGVVIQVPVNNRQTRVVKDSMYVQKLENAPIIQMQKTSYDIDMRNQKHSYERMAEILRQRNPYIDPRTIQFNTILFKMRRHLENNDGQLVADDYNFYVEQFNTVNHIIRDIEATSLPDNAKDQKIKEYVNRILGKGEVIDIQAEIKKLHNQGLSAN